MKVALVQAKLFWEDSNQNLAHFTSLLEEVEDVDLFVLPEMFNTGFTMNTESLGQTMNGKAVNWLIKMAKEKDAAFIASIIIKI